MKNCNYWIVIYSILFQMNRANHYTLPLLHLNCEMRHNLNVMVCSIDIFSLSRTVFEKIRVKILWVKQNGGFWPFQGWGHWLIFLISRKGSESHQTTSIDILRVDEQPCFSHNICCFSAEQWIKCNFNPYELFYLMIIGLSWKILNLRFELFDFELVRDWPRPLKIRRRHKSEI